MNKRSIEVTIYKAGTTDARCKVGIYKGAVAKFTLMKEDYITLKFSLPSLVRFGIGDYVNIQEKAEVKNGFPYGLAVVPYESMEEYVFDQNVRDVLASKYELTEISVPSYNYRRGSYDYELKLHAYYRAWSKFLCKMPCIHTEDGVSTIIRNDVEWSLTDKCENQVAAVLMNLRALGIKYKTEDFGDVDFAGEVHLDSGTTIWVTIGLDGLIHVEKNEKGGRLAPDLNKPVVEDDKGFVLDDTAQNISYNQTNIIAALDNIAKAWDCDWWVSGNVIHIGRLEDQGNGLLPAEKNVVTMDDVTALNASGGGKFYTRLFAYGGTRNIPDSYRKILFFNAGANRKESYELTDGFKLLKTSMFRDSCKTTQSARLSHTAITNSGISTFLAYTKQERSHFTYTITRATNAVHYESTISSASGDKIRGDIYLAKASALPFTRTGGDFTGTFSYMPYNYTAYWIQGPSQPTNKVRIKIIGTNQNRDDEVVYDKEYTLNQYDTLATASNDVLRRATISLTDLRQRYFTLSEFANYIITFEGTYDTQIICGATNLFFESLNPMVDFKVNMEIGGTIHELDAYMNKDYLANENMDAKRIFLKNDDLVIPNGARYTISEDYIMPGRVNAAYYVDEDDKMSVNTIGTTRLRMRDQDGNPVDYVDAVIGKDQDGSEISIPETDVVEGVLVDDTIFPHREDTILEISKRQYAESKVDANTGETYKDPFTAYLFKAQLASADFSKDYVLEGDGLSITFSSGRLNGMTFKVVWNPVHEGETAKPEVVNGSRNPDACWFEIIKSEEYGTLLPNEVLYPSNFDKFVLWGYSSEYLAKSIVEEAEKDLYIRAKATLEKAIRSDKTYNVTLKHEYVANNGLLRPGNLVELETPNYYDNKRTERVIGYEIKLDIPEDSPVYQVGETARFSRIADIEKRIKK